MPKTSYVVAVGDAFAGGLRLFGPFDSDPAARAWAEHWKFQRYVVLPMTRALVIHTGLTDNPVARAITRARPPKGTKP